MFPAMLLQETIISGFLSVAVMLATLLLLSFHEPAHAADKIAVAAAFLQSSTPSDPLANALQRFARIASYQVMVRSVSSQDETKVIRYSYRKPGYVRMDFSTPHAGAVLIYNPSNGKVTLWPFGAGTFPVLKLSPTDSLITDENGHRVDQSDIGVLLSNIRRLQQGGATRLPGEEMIAGKPAVHLSVVGAEGKSVAAVHRYEVWFDKQSGLPTKVVSYGLDGKLLETVMMEAMSVNVRFPPDFFAP